MENYGILEIEKDELTAAMEDFIKNFSRVPNDADSAVF